MGDVPWKVSSRNGARSGLSYIHKRLFYAASFLSELSVLACEDTPFADMRHRCLQEHLKQLIFHAQAWGLQRLRSHGCHHDRSI